jgi:hypothetical protein
VDDRAAALEVREELVAEPSALCRALDEPRDVGEDELAILRLEGAQDGLHGRERIFGDLRSGAG